MFSLSLTSTFLLCYNRLIPFPGRPLWISIAKRWSWPVTPAPSCSKRRRNLPRAGDDDPNSLRLRRDGSQRLTRHLQRRFSPPRAGTDHALSLVRHVPLGGVNLSRIDAVNAVSREICAGKWSMDEAEAALTRVERSPRKAGSRTSSPTRWARRASAICSAGRCWTASRRSPIGFLLQSTCSPPKAAFRLMPYIWGSVLVTLLSRLLAACFPALNASWVVIGGIVPMVPGVTFTTSIRGIFQRRLSLRRDSLHQRRSDRHCASRWRMRRRDAAGLYGRHCAMMGQVLSAFLGVFSFAILFHAPRRGATSPAPSAARSPGAAICSPRRWGCFWRRRWPPSC